MRAFGEALALACCCAFATLCRAEKYVVPSGEEWLLIFASGLLLWTTIHLIASYEARRP